MYTLMSIRPYRWCVVVVLALNVIPGLHAKDHENGTRRCSEVLSVNASVQCQFVQQFCHIDGGFFHYLQFPYCSLSTASAAGFAILGLWMMYLFVVLGVTADEFFCPCLQTLAKMLRMSDSMAGVTLLALGNGAPDIFSVIAAVNGSNHRGASLGFQALFGAGMFVTTIVAGCIHFKVSFRFARRPFTRDVVFYLAAIAWTFVVIYRESIRTREAIGFIALYVIYVLFVVIGQTINRRIRGSESEPLLRADFANDLEESARFTDARYAQRAAALESSIQEVTSDSETDADVDMFAVPPMETFTSRLTGVSALKWQAGNTGWKLFMLLKFPVMVILNLTIPIVDTERQGMQFNKALLMLQCLFFPTTSVFLTGGYTILIYRQFAMWHCSLAVGALMAIIIALLASRKRCPRYYPVFSLAGFAMSVIWIYAMANEAVNLLQSLGIAFGISDAVIGLTFLAWGNSIGDFISNMAVASRGTPRMAIAACFGGPLLNMLLGVGISCTISSVSNGNHVRLIRGDLQYIISAAFLALSLTASLGFLIITGFYSKKYFAVFLFILYLSYISISVLTELNIIPH